MYLPRAAPNAAHQGVAVARAGDRHDPRPEPGGDLARAVGAAVVGHDRPRRRMPCSRSASCALRMHDRQRVRLVQAGHDDGQLDRLSFTYERDQELFGSGNRGAHLFQANCRQIAAIGQSGRQSTKRPGWRASLPAVTTITPTSFHRRAPLKAKALEESLLEGTGKPPKQPTLTFQQRRCPGPQPHLP